MSICFSFNQLIPSPKFAVQNQALLDAAKAEGFSLVGVEVTEKAFSSQLHLNIDPQHAEGLNLSASKKIFDDGVMVEAEKVALFTTRLDPDSVGGMALVVATLRRQRHLILPERVDEINRIDTSKTDGWEARPIREDVMPEVSDYHSLSEYYSDRNASLEAKVLTTLAWLKGDDVSETLKAASAGALKNKQLLGDALKSGAAQVTITPSGVAVFKGPGYGGAAFGYKFSPVAVLFDAVGSRNGGQPKWTVCQFSAGYADISAIQQELNQLETAAGKWGPGGATTGSPQNEASCLTEEVILEVIQRHLLPKLAEAVSAPANAAQIQSNLEFARNLAAG
jgi:hypothetical protein